MKVTISLFDTSVNPPSRTPLVDGSFPSFEELFKEFTKNVKRNFPKFPDWALNDCKNSLQGSWANANRSGEVDCSDLINRDRTLMQHAECWGLLNRKMTRE